MAGPSNAVTYTWLNRQGVRSSEGMEVQYTGRHTMEVRWGNRRKTFEVEGVALPHHFELAHFERWDNSAVANDIEEQRHILAAFRKALEFMSEDQRS